MTNGEDIDEDIELALERATELMYGLELGHDEKRTSGLEVILKQEYEIRVMALSLYSIACSLQRIAADGDAA